LTARFARWGQVVVLNKIDAGTTHGSVDELRAAFAARGIELLTMSAATGEGVRDVLEALWKLLAATPRA